MFCTRACPLEHAGVRVRTRFCVRAPACVSVCARARARVPVPVRAHAHVLACARLRACIVFGFLSYFFVKKYLLVGASDMSWAGGSVNHGSGEQWISAREMYYVTSIRLDVPLNTYS